MKYLSSALHIKQMYTSSHNITLKSVSAPQKAANESKLSKPINGNLRILQHLRFWNNYVLNNQAHPKQKTRISLNNFKRALLLRLHCVSSLSPSLDNFSC